MFNIFLLSLKLLFFDLILFFYVFLCLNVCTKLNLIVFFIQQHAFLRLTTNLENVFFLFNHREALHVL